MAVEARAWITGEYPNQKINFELPSGPKGDPGGWVATTINSGGDLDTYRTAGTYQVPSATGVLNLPGFDAGTLQVNSRITGGIYESSDQIFTPYSGTISARVVYRRAYVSQVWTPWRMFTSTRVDNTAGKAIYQWDDTAGREQLIYGDTGWRDMGTFGLDGVTGVFRLCRVGSSVFLMGSITKETAGTTFKAGSIPAGFRPRGSVETLLTQGTGMTLNGKLVAQYSGQVVWYTPPGSVTASVFEISWRTAEAWPKTLPGTADGTIPNL